MRKIYTECTSADMDIVTSSRCFDLKISYHAQSADLIHKKIKFSSSSMLGLCLHIIRRTIRSITVSAMYDASCAYLCRYPLPAWRARMYENATRTRERGSLQRCCSIRVFPRLYLYTPKFFKVATVSLKTASSIHSERLPCASLHARQIILQIRQSLIQYRHS